MPQNARLWFADGPQPFHHVTLPMAVEGMPEGWTARVLYLHRPDGTVEMFEPLLKYFKAHPTRKSSWQDTVAQGLGLLWDYGLATSVRDPKRHPRICFAISRSRWERWALTRPTRRGFIGLERRTPAARG
jgi:hypothetical protein